MERDQFEKIAETGPVIPGSHDIILITDDVNWMAFRLDRSSGAVWQMRGNKWIRVKEPGEGN